MEYEVLESGHVLMPYIYLSDHNDVTLFATLDQDPKWKRQHRAPSRYRSIVWISGNFLAPGRKLVKRLCDDGPDADTTFEGGKSHFF